MTYIGFYFLIFLGYLNELFCPPVVAKETNREVSCEIHVILGLLPCPPIKLSIPRPTITMRGTWPLFCVNTTLFKYVSIYSMGGLTLFLSRGLPFEPCFQIFENP